VPRPTTSQSHRGVVVWAKNQHACAKTRGSFVEHLKQTPPQNDSLRRCLFQTVILRGCLFQMFGSTLVVKIKKTQESTPSVLVMPKKNNRDKENIILPFFTTGRLGPLVQRRGPNRLEFPRCFPEKVDLNFRGDRNPIFSMDAIRIQSLRRCLFLLFGSTHVVKIKKTQESTPSILKRITEDKVYYRSIRASRPKGVAL
jgi:hypothetical protein